MDTNQVFLIVLLIVLAVVVFFELRFMRSRNKDHIQMIVDKDDAYNAIMTAKAIASSLKQRGRDTKEAEEVIIRAEASYKRNSFITARDTAVKAKDLLMNSPILEAAAPAKAAEAAPEEEHRTVHEVKKLEPNLLESRFIIHACQGDLEAAERAGKDTTKAKEILASAERSFEERRYDEALCEGQKARRLLCDDSSSQAPPKDAVIVKVPKTERRCEKCSAVVGQDDAFCRKCGEPIVHRRNCPHCRAEMEDGDLFCPKCGRRP